MRGGRVITLRLTESDMSRMEDLKTQMEKALGISLTQSQVIRACLRSAYSIAIEEVKDNDN